MRPRDSSSDRQQYGGAAKAVVTSSSLRQLRTVTTMLNEQCPHQGRHFKGGGSTDQVIENDVAILHLFFVVHKTKKL